jgi:ABC-type sulfate transport system permease subunit
MVEEAHPSEGRFRPLRPASRLRLIAALVIGPLMWIVALVVAAWVIDRTDAIGKGLLVTVAAFVVAAPVLGLLWRARKREERRYADRA